MTISMVLLPQTRLRVDGEGTLELGTEGCEKRKQMLRLGVEGYNLEAVWVLIVNVFCVQMPWGSGSVYDFTFAHNYLRLIAA